MPNASLSELKQSLDELNSTISQTQEKNASLTEDLGKLGSGLSGIGSSVSNLNDLFSGAMSSMGVNVESLTGSVSVFAQSLSGIGEVASLASTIGEVASLGAGMGTLGIAAVAVSGVIAYGAYLFQEQQKSAQELAESQQRLGDAYAGVGEAAASFYNGISSAGSVMDGFNSSILMSNESQNQLATDMTTVQETISQIVRDAVAARGELNQQDMAQLDEQFAKMAELSEQELAMQQGYQEAVETRAEALADSHQGSLEEYEAYAQQLINSAEETKQQTIDKANEQFTEELALKKQMMGTSSEYDEEWFNQQKETLQQQYQQNVDAANQECGDTIAILQQGYLDRATHLQDYVAQEDELKQQEADAANAYAEKLQEIDAADYKARTENAESYSSEKGKLDSDRVTAEQEYQKKLKEINDQRSSSMDEATTKEIGAWMAMASETEIYQGKLSDESQKAADNVLRGFDNLPEDSKKAMQNAMQPMYDEMQNKEGGLFEKAKGIAGGILSRLKSSFDINSPSRKTRAIFNSVMEGAEMGLEDERGSLLAQADSISRSVLNKLQSPQAGGYSSLYQQMLQSVGAEVSRFSSLPGSAPFIWPGTAGQAGGESGLIPASGKIKTVLNIDGREFAVATANYMSEELAWRNL